MADTVTIAAPENAACLIHPIGAITIFRLKTWLAQGRPMLQGMSLPSQVGAVLVNGMRVLCLAPGDWLIVSESGNPGFRQELAQAAAAEEGLMLIDMSDGLCGIDVTGAAVRQVLGRGCGLDLHPRVFGAPQCARTRLAQIPVVIERLDGEERFALYVSRSYLSYLIAWLRDAALGIAECNA